VGAPIPERAVTNPAMKPLCVDLDGTLIKSDLLWEQTLASLRARPAMLLEMIGWTLRGKAYFKERMAALPLPGIDPAIFNGEVLAWLREEAATGRRVHLVTAAHRKAAAAAAEWCGCFAEVSSSTAECNLSGDRKAQFLRERYGEKQFDYVGNSAHDLPAWLSSDTATAVRTRPNVLSRLRRTHSRVEVLGPLPSLARSLWRELRPHQLVKNLLLFLPLILAHRVGDGAALLRATLAFLAFSGAAAAGYCFNDLFDLAADRLDARKSRRPLASGELEPAAGAALAVGAGIFAALMAAPLPGAFRAALALYLAVTPVYSLVLKRQVGADVLALTGLYVLRVLAGGLATGIPVTQWLLSFSLFFFLSLSLVKRYGELLVWENKLAPGEPIPGRGYQPRDKEMIRSFGCASGYVSVLVFILYINNPATAMLYPFPELLWCIGLMLVYWLNRLWLLAGRGLIPGDPIPFIFKDRVSWIVAFIIGFVVFGAALWKLP
jgi:4-hydroxybenzoate polyprenyltransferase